MNETSNLTNGRAARSAEAKATVAPAAFQRMLTGTASAACIGLLVYKVFLSNRLNVNWDEFYFLSHVYELARGDLNLLLLGAYTHLFSWLPMQPGDEIQQIVAGRWVMLALLCATCWLIWRLARVWLTGFAALVPCFVYLSAMPVMVHGGSFRYDSLLAPLSVAPLILLTSSGQRRWRDWTAGALIGVAFVVTVKVVLFAPLFAALVLFGPGDGSSAGGTRLRDASMTLTRVAVTAGIVAAILIGLHSLTIVQGTSDSVTGFATGAARKTLLDTPWFPRIYVLKTYVHWQPLHWLLIALGSLLALARRRLDLASLSLGLLPVAFYRNAFPYYYVVMLAPASVLAGYTVHEMAALVRRYASEAVTSALLATIWIGLLYQGLAYAGRLRFDDQANQRILVAAVHQVFPEPVNYVDRCGMISSFRKVNFFMSTWGMDNYRERNEPFMPAVIRTGRPAFILVNSDALNPNAPSAAGLLPKDYDLIERYFPEYWGPLRVAGASGTVSGSESAQLLVPFPDDYRIETTAPVLVDGVLHRHGDVIYVPADGVRVAASDQRASPGTTSVRLFLASARPPPKTQPLSVPLFAGLL